LRSSKYDSIQIELNYYFASSKIKKNPGIEGGGITDILFIAAISAVSLHIPDQGIRCRYRLISGTLLMIHYSHPYFGYENGE